MNRSEYTQAILANSDQHDLELLVKPGTDFDDCFTAICRDTGEILRVNGWLFTVELDG